MNKVMDLNAVRQFIKVAECLSFTEAAVQLGLTQSGLSRAVSRLEQQLGVRLLHRNTRSLSLTPDGQLFLARCAPLVSGLEEARISLQENLCLPKGLLKISAPSAFGRVVVLPIVSGLLARYPELKIEMELTDRLVDLVDEGFDAVIRTGEIKDSRLIARPLKALEWATLASPGYLASHGAPDTPAALRQHNCLRVRSPLSGKPVSWRFSEGGSQQEYDFDGNLILDHGDPLLEAACLDTGVVQLMRYFVDDALQQGKLQEILPTYAPRPHPLFLVYQPSRQHSAKLEVLRQALLDQWGG